MSGVMSFLQLLVLRGDKKKFLSRFDSFGPHTLGSDSSAMDGYYLD